MPIRGRRFPLREGFLELNDRDFVAAFADAQILLEQAEIRVFVCFGVPISAFDTW